MGTKHQSQVIGNREYLRQYKDMHSCSCGESRNICLDFHHKDPSTKSFELSDISSKGFAKIKAEIDKCILLCANCHRVLHAELGMTEAVEKESNLPLLQNLELPLFD